MAKKSRKGARAKNAHAAPSPDPAASAAQGKASRRAWLVPLALVGLALLPRTVRLVELRDDPTATLQDWGESDMAFFDEWATVIAEGDLLTDRSLHPFHVWHQWLADAWFRLHPEDRQEMEAAAEATGVESAAHALWDDWYGGKGFHQAPLYPYFLACVRAVFGAGYLPVAAVQLALGAASVGLLFLVTRRAFGERVAIVAGVLTVLFAPLLHYEVLRLRVAVIVFLVLAFGWLFGRALDRRRWLDWSAVGVIGGLAVLTKPTLVMLPAGALAVLVVRDALEARASGSAQRLLGVTWKQVAAAVVGGALVYAPVVARNVSVGVRPLGLSGVGTITFVVANGGHVNPRVPGMRDVAAEAKLLDQGGLEFLPTVAACLRSHGSVGHFIGHEWKKLRATWHWYEVANNSNFYMSRSVSTTLALLPLTFRLIGPLAMVGLVLAVRRRCDDVPLWLLLATAFVPLLAFHVLGRYRCLFAVTLLPFAALAAVQVFDWARRREWGPVVGAGFGLLVALAFGGGPSPMPDGTIVRPDDVTTAGALHYKPRYEALTAEDRWDEACDLLAEFLRTQPRSVRELGPSRPARGPHVTRLASYFAQVHDMHANSLRAAGRAEQAAQASARARELRQAASGS